MGGNRISTWFLKTSKYKKDYYLVNKSHNTKSSMIQN